MIPHSVNEMIHTNINVNEKGHLTFGKADCVSLANKYGTPLYLLDEARLRKNCREYREAVTKYFGEDSLPLYASKALCCKELYRVINEEGLGADIVSGGELYTALCTGFPAEKIYFHGNNKTDAEIVYALDKCIGCFVVDNHDELEFLNRECIKRGIKQRVLLRVSPGIDPHTHRAVVTGNVDSKFGVPIETGQAFEFVRRAFECKGIDVDGLHCHIGSQIFDKYPFTDAARIMLSFAAKIKKELGAEFKTINLGGGIGVRYVETDPISPIDVIMKGIKEELDKLVAEAGINTPVFLFEMGRFVVADAGMTLYTVGSVKHINGFKDYVCVDGGMTDNPRYALYGSKYTVFNATHADREYSQKADVAGRNCESDDVIGEAMSVQQFERGDILAVAVTGAYNYSMASNYNRVPRPAMVSINNGEDKLIVRRETYEDMGRNEI